MGVTCKVAVLFSRGVHNRAKAAKSGRPPRAPQAGVAVPNGPACTSPPPCIMLARLVPHECRIPRCPPCQSPAHRAAGADSAGPQGRRAARARAAPPIAAHTRSGTSW
eukprot:3257315-Prymnesium_polylepis.1